MGVKWLVRWVSKAGLLGGGDDGVRSGSADEDMLMQIMEQLGCKAIRDSKTSKLEVKCHILKQQQLQAQQGSGQGMKDMFLVQSSDVPETCFLVDKAQHAVLEADNGMLTLVEKKLEYRIKTCVTFSGKRFTKGDFGVRVASASASVMGQSGGITFLGYMIELEYMPVSSPAVASGMMSAFLEMMRAQIPLSLTGMPMGSLERPRDSTDRYLRLPDTFSHQHSAVLYVDLTMSLLVERRQQQQQLLQAGKTA